MLDNRLEEVRLLRQHDHPGLTLSLEERRLVASQCARVATWDATPRTTPAPRQAAERTAIGPIRLVSTPADVAAAQRRLAAFLRPTHAGNSAYLGDPKTQPEATQV